MAERIDDGRRYMPKLKCPYGNHRFADVPNVFLRNNSELRRFSEETSADFILECPRCHQKIALCIKPLHNESGELKRINTTTCIIL